MTFAVADVIASVPNPFAPFVVVQLPVQVHIAAAQPDFFAVDAGEIRLPANPGAEPRIERVVPDVEFPRVRRIHGRNEIHRWNQLAVGPGNLMGDVHDVFVGSNPIESGHSIIGKQIARHF